MTPTAPSTPEETLETATSLPAVAGRGWARGVGLGLATAAAALGAAELTAGLARRFASPITQVGNRVIDAAPPWLKTFAIEKFGTNDKTVLIGSVFVVLLIFAAALGILSRRHRTWSLIGISLFGVIGVAAAIAGIGGFLASVPSIVGGVVGVLTLRFLADRTWGAAPVVDDHAAGAGNSGPVLGEVLSNEVTANEVDPDARVDKNPNNRPLSSVITQPSRRVFLTAAGAVTAVGLVAAAGGRWARTRFDAAVDRAKVVLPKAKRPLAPIDVAQVTAPTDGVTPFLTPIENFYRVDTALEVPQVAVADWALTVTGMVDKKLSFTFDELLQRDLVEADMTLTCVSNEVGGQLAGTARWLGVPLRELLDEAGASKDADQIVGRSVDGYTCGFPVSAVDGRTAMVVVGMNGEPLPIIHGFPARLLVAGLYGYVSATKWLTEIEITRFDRFEQYWVPRGYTAEAPIKTFSRIDTPKPLTNIPAGTHAIAGVAWAQTRGISKVEVKIDDGPWQQSTLAAAPNTGGSNGTSENNETWRQWYLQAELTSGSHNVTCRATDGNGDTQPEERAPIRPNGVTGWHSVVVLVS